VNLRSALWGWNNVNPNKWMSISTATSIKANITPDALNELWQANHAAMASIDRDFIRAQQYLDTHEWILVREIVSSNLISTKGRISQDDAVKGQLSDLAEYLTGYVSRNAEKVARRRLARGLLRASIASIGLLIMIVLSVVGTLLLSGFGVGLYELLTMRDVVVCIGGASIGAVTSVLLRIRHVEKLDYETLDQGAANYRVALGWLFGAALLLLVKGGVLTVIAQPHKGMDATATGFYWAGIGFLAGFNERWAGSLVSRDREAATPTQVG
jgi:hypothetical protein